MGDVDGGGGGAGNGRRGGNIGRGVHYSDRTSRLATRLRTWKYFGLRDSGANENRNADASAVAWTVALVWALAISLAGYVRTREGEEDVLGEDWGWEEVLDWIFRRG